jgi:hypothetical protein
MLQWSPSGSPTSWRPSTTGVHEDGGEYGGNPSRSRAAVEGWRRGSGRRGELGSGAGKAEEKWWDWESTRKGQMLLFDSTLVGHWASRTGPKGISGPTHSIVGHPSPVRADRWTGCTRSSGPTQTNRPSDQIHPFTKFGEWMRQRGRCADRVGVRPSVVGPGL